MSDTETASIVIAVIAFVTSLIAVIVAYLASNRDEFKFVTDLFNAFERNDRLRLALWMLDQHYNGLQLPLPEWARLAEEDRTFILDSALIAPAIYDDYGVFKQNWTSQKVVYVTCIHAFCAHMEDIITASRIRGLPPWMSQKLSAMARGYGEQLKSIQNVEPSAKECGYTVLAEWLRERAFHV